VMHIRLTFYECRCYTNACLMSLSMLCMTPCHPSVAASKYQGYEGEGTHAHAPSNARHDSSDSRGGTNTN
jgi:hypothetical protein